MLLQCLYKQTLQKHIRNFPKFIEILIIGCLNIFMVKKFHDDRYIKEKKALHEFQLLKINTVTIKECTSIY